MTTQEKYTQNTNRPSNAEQRALFENNQLVNGNVEGIEQALKLLNQLTDENYIHLALPYVTSSIGAHFRHIIDLYFAIMTHTEHQGYIDYDTRRRGAKVETCRETATQELQLIKNWLCQLTQQDLESTVTIQTETSIYQQQIYQMKSSLQRELVFVASHTTHHFATIRVAAQDCQIETDQIFSYAPATASYLRSLS